MSSNISPWACLEKPLSALSRGDHREVDHSIPHVRQSQLYAKELTATQHARTHGGIHQDVAIWPGQRLQEANGVDQHLLQRAFPPVPLLLRTVVAYGAAVCSRYTFVELRHQRCRLLLASAHAQSDRERQSERASERARERERAKRDRSRTSRGVRERPALGATD
jgi:hypothetical protein